MLKKHVVIKRPSIKPLKLDYKTIILFTLFFCGIIFGSMIIGGKEGTLHNIMSNVISDSIAFKYSNNLLMYFLSVFSGFAIILLYDYICGLCGFGMPFLYLTPVSLGVLFSIIIGAFYMNYGLSGIGYCVLINVPCYAITAATLIKCCCYSKKISEDVLIYLVSGKADKKDGILKEYTIKYLFYGIIIALSSLISALSFRLFSHLFSFV